MSVRTRYAPSPTGDLHLGSLRTVIFAYLFAKHEGGTFMLRVEDTDQAREVPGAVASQLEAMKWMDLLPDEGVCLDDDGNITEKGDVGPYTQSKRLHIYKEWAEKLLESGHAYRCFCSAERLAEMRAEQEKNHQPPKYDRLCRALSAEESAKRAQSEPFVIRHKIPDGQPINVTDIVRGDLQFQSSELDDYVLMKSDGFPTYQLANVVDDHLMDISHVLRGEEWLPSLPKNLLLYGAFGWTPPQYAHLPVILGPDGKKKLSKRDGRVSVLEYREVGYLPNALCNALAFIGWSPGTEEEFFNRDELIEKFDLNRVQKAPAKFDFARLDYVNGWYIRQMKAGDLAEHMIPYLEKAGITPASPDYLLSVAGILQERFKHFDETEEISWFFFNRPEINEQFHTVITPKKLTLDETKENIRFVISHLENHDDWTHDALHETLILAIAKAEKKNGDVLWPVRAALTGMPASPGAFEMLTILGKEESLTRLQAACN